MSDTMRVEGMILLALCLVGASAYGKEAEDIKTGRPLPFVGSGTCEAPEKIGDGVTFVRCLGPVIPMLPGQTLDSYIMLESPYPKDRNVTVLKQQGQMVEQINNHTWRPVPLSELYLHHTVPNVRFIIGQGAEIRGSMNTPELPRPYAFIADGADCAKEQKRLTNIQLVNIEGVPQENLQESVECWCGQPRSEATSGSLICCTQNPTLSRTPGPKNYQLEYNVTFRDVWDEDVSTELTAIDVVGGEFEYNIIDALGPNTTHTRAYEMAIDESCPQNQTIRIVRCFGHQHIGSIGMHMYNAETNEKICSSGPIYGNATGEPGNELGFVTAIEHTDLKPAYEIAPGTKVRVESVYDGSQKRLGIMGVMAMHVAGWNRCNDNLYDGQRMQTAHTMQDERQLPAVAPCRCQNNSRGFSCITTQYCAHLRRAVFFSEHMCLHVFLMCCEAFMALRF